MVPTKSLDLPFLVLHVQVIAVDQDPLGFQGERILGGDLTAAGGVRPR